MRERVSKTEAKRRLLKEKPNKMNCAKAVKNPTKSNPIPSTNKRNGWAKNGRNSTMFFNFGYC